MDNFEELNCGANIKSLRLKHKLTQAQFAEIIGKTQSTVLAYENNTVIPPFDVVMSICNIFNISVGALLGLEDLKEPDEPIELVRERLNFDSDNSDELCDDEKKLYDEYIRESGQGEKEE